MILQDLQAFQLGLIGRARGIGGRCLQKFRLDAASLRCPIEARTSATARTKAECFSGSCVPAFPVAAGDSGVTLTAEGSGAADDPLDCGTVGGAIGGDTGAETAATTLLPAGAGDEVSLCTTGSYTHPRQGGRTRRRCDHRGGRI